VFLCPVEGGDDLHKQITDALGNSIMCVVLGTLTYGLDTKVGFSTYDEMMFIKTRQVPFFLIKMCNDFQEDATKLAFPAHILHHLWIPAAPPAVVSGKPFEEFQRKLHAAEPSDVLVEEIVQMFDRVKPIRHILASPNNNNNNNTAKRPLRDLSVDDVACLLDGCGLSEYRNAFAANRIDGIVLVSGDYEENCKMSNVDAQRWLRQIAEWSKDGVSVDLLDKKNSNHTTSYDPRVASKDLTRQQAKAIPLADYLRALEQRPNDGVIYCNLARHLMDGGSVELKTGAMMTQQQCFLKAIECDPSNSMAYNCLGFMLPRGGSVNMKNGVTMTEQQCYLKAIECDSNNSMAYYNLGTTCSLTGSIALHDGRKMTITQLLNYTSRRK
jgi:hypothetical protein